MFVYCWHTAPEVYRLSEEVMSPAAHILCAGAATPVVSGRLAACRAPGCWQPDATASPETAHEEQHLAWAERGLPEEDNLQALLWRQCCPGFSFLGLELVSLQCSYWKWRA